MGPHDPGGGHRLVVLRRLLLEAAVLLESEPLPVVPLPTVATGLLRELGTVGAGIDGHRLACRGGALDDSRVNCHGGGHLVCRQRHRVVLHAAPIAIYHLTILRASGSVSLNELEARWAGHRGPPHGAPRAGHARFWPAAP